MTVLGADLSLIRRISPGSSTLTLSPGIYKVIASAGDASHSQLVEVVQGEETVPRIEPVRFASAAPLRATRKTHEYHTYTAQALSKAQPRVLGNGAQLFFFSRYWTGRAGSERPVSHPTHPLKGMSFHRLSGDTVINVEAESLWVTSDPYQPDEYASLLVELDPGPYRLRLETKTFGIIEQCIWLSKGWQTQVFCLVRDVDPGPAVEHVPDLSTAAILMARPEEGFDPYADYLTLTEIARAGLITRRPLLSPSDLQALLYGKFENPMLGLLGAHLLVRTEPEAQGQLRVVVDNMRRLVGVHPDVEIIAASYLGESSPNLRGVLGAPPMLARSWELLSNLTLEDETLVPSGSLASGVGAARWGAGIWLSWLLEELRAVEPALPEAHEEAFAGDSPSPGEIPDVTGTSIGTDPDFSLNVIRNQMGRLEEKDEELTGLEQAFARAMRSDQRGQFGASYLTREGVTESATGKLNRGSLARAFGMPASSVNLVLSNIAKKLSE